MPYEKFSSFIAVYKRIITKIWECIHPLLKSLRDWLNNGNAFLFAGGRVFDGKLRPLDKIKCLIWCHLIVTHSNMFCYHAAYLFGRLFWRLLGFFGGNETNTNNVKNLQLTIASRVLFRGVVCPISFYRVRSYWNSRYFRSLFCFWSYLGTMKSFSQGNRAGFSIQVSCFFFCTDQDP